MLELGEAPYAGGVSEQRREPKQPVLVIAGAGGVLYPLGVWEPCGGPGRMPGMLPHAVGHGGGLWPPWRPSSPYW